MTYREMLERIARLLGRRPLIVEVPALAPRLSSLWLYLVTPVQASVARPLVQGMRYPTVVRDDRIRPGSRSSRCRSRPRCEPRSQLAHADGRVYSSGPWRRSRSDSSAARSRTSTRTTCVSGCSPTAMTSATPTPTSRSSTRAASRTRPSRSRGRRRRGRRGRTAASTSRAAARISPPSVRRLARERRRRREAERGDAGVRRRRRRRDRLRPGRRAARPRARLRQGAGRLLASRATSASSRSCAAHRAAAPPRRCSARSRRRVAQGHREIVLTGINLGCYRDRAAGYDLPRLVREAGATPGLERLRLSSIEINHVDDELIAALRETPTVAPPPARAAPVGRRRRAARDGPPLLGRDVPAPARAAAGEFNLTSDVIVGFPAEDERAFESTLRTVARGRADEGARVPVLAAARTVHGGRRPGAAAGEEGARCAAARRFARRVPRALADEDRSRRPRARRPPRPRLRRRLLAVARRRAAPVGAFVRCAARRSPTRECSPRERRLPLLHALPRRRPRRDAPTASSRSATSTRRPTTHLLIIPEHHIDTFRDIGEFSADEDEADARLRRRSRSSERA